MRKMLLAAVAATAFATPAFAGAIIDNGTGIQLGVNDEGHLNFGNGSPSVSGTTLVGLRHLVGGGVERESTSHGCECEGWGVAAGGQSGAANIAANGGAQNLSLVSFNFGGAGTDAESVGSTAESIVEMGNVLRITHTFAPSASDNLYSVKVRIENISGADLAQLLYRRTFDWDIDPTPFSEYSTIGGTAGATAVIGANDNGFCSSDPTDPCSPLTSSGDFVDAGPGDIGANFDFDFGALAAGGIFEFEIFYGAAFSEREAFAALAAVGAEVYSFGQSIGDKDGGNGSTFIFAFKGVGGDPIGVPEPAALGLLGLGLVGLGAARRRRKA